MLTGFYTAASGVKVQERTLNVLSNNMANVKTPGFRVQRVVSTTFEQQLMMRMDGSGKTQIGRPASPMRLVQDVVSDFDPNFLEETGRPLDVALVGEGFFNIRTDGDATQFLTRDGSFALDEEGFLVKAGIGRVLGERGEIQPGNAGFTIDVDGTVRDADDKVLDKLLVTYPEATNMQKYANGMYTLVDAAQNTPAVGCAVQQGTLENSNIDLNREFTLAMEAQRTFQSCSSALKIIDQINQKAASQIASL